MASPAGPLVYWCHQCNVQTRPPVGDDVACTFCNQGFIEELDSTEVEPGVVFSTLPLAFGNFLRRPSPASVGTTRDRSTTDSPSSPHQSSVFSSPSPSAAAAAAVATTSLEGRGEQTPPGQQQTDPQGHRPRILSGQLSGVSSLLEAMMQVIEEMNGPFPPSSRSASGNLDDAHEQGDPILHGDDGVHVRVHGPRDSGDDSDRRGESRSQAPTASQEVVNAVVLPTPAPVLILHGGMPDVFRGLEIFVDNGQGMGPQMMPNHFTDYFMGPDLDRLIQMLAENDPNRYGTPPAAKSAVEKLPKFKISKEHLGFDILQCAVCKDDFELDAEVQQMPCKHFYHPDCLLPWLAEHNSCPVCRYELPTDDADYEARKGQSRSTHTNAEGQGMRMRTSSNLSEGQRVEAHGSDNEELPDNGSQESRQFTLWGMPARGFDMTRLSMVGTNPITRTEYRPDSGQGAEMAQTQEVSREGGIRDGAPVQWLFRLFSSGSMSAQENASNGERSSGEQSSDPGSGRNASNT